jgi:hypothetical protein
VALHDAAEPLLGFLELAAREVRFGQSERKLGDKIVRRQVAFESVSFGAVRVRDDDGRGPLCAEALETLRVLLYVNFYWNKTVL